MTTQKPTIDLADLRAKAEAATCCDQESNFRYMMERTSIPTSLCKFIDAARPLTVLSLLNSLEAVRVAVERAKSVRASWASGQTASVSAVAAFETLIEELEGINQQPAAAARLTQYMCPHGFLELTACQECRT